MTATGEWSTARPRKASAGTRRHRIKYLTWQLRQHYPNAHQVFVTPITWADDSDRPDVLYTVSAYDSNGRRIVGRPAANARVVALLQGAFPAADWWQPQTWHAATNRLSPAQATATARSAA